MNDFVVLTNNSGRLNADWAKSNFNLDTTTKFDGFVILTNNFGMNFKSTSPSTPAVPSLPKVSQTAQRTMGWCFEHR